MDTETVNQAADSRWTRNDQLFVLALLLFGAAVFGWRTADLTIRGEESRRALVAVEILRSGDWVVPRLQNELYFSRPPLQNWLIAGAGIVRGTIDEWSIRWYSSLATTLTGVMIFFYCRSFMSSAGAFIGGLSFLTTFHILELGQLGETEALFTLLLSSSLMVWHMGEMRGWKPATRWCLGYSIAALATLAKGPQAPVYFCGAIGIYSLLKRDWKILLHWGHFAGIGLFVALVGSWLVPYGIRAGWESVPKIFMDNVGLQFARQTSWDLVEHMATYPFEILACLLPWSPFLISFFQKSFRDSIRPVWPQLSFSVLVMILAFPSVWMVPGAQTRYYMPIYPFFAPLVALSIQGCWSGERVHHWQFGWARLTNIMMAVAIAIAAVTFCSALMPDSVAEAIAYSSMQWLAISGMAAALAVILWKTRGLDSQRAVAAGGLASAAVLGLIWTTGWTQAIVQRSISIESRVAELAAEIPDDAIVISLADVDHKFGFYFGRPIERIEPDDIEARTAGLTADELKKIYFCFKENSANSYEPQGIPLVRVAEIPTDRHRDAHESKQVVLARMTDAAIASRSSAEPSPVRRIAIRPDAD